MDTTSTGLIIAEIGCNHGGDPALAAKMVKAAANSGAWAIKFQAYKTSLFLHPQNPYHHDLAAEELSFSHISSLMKLAKDLGLAAGLTVFGPEGLDLAEQTNADFIKISSGDLTFHHLLRQAAQAGRPLILSTGASQEIEVAAALDQISLATQVTVLQCTSLYPCPAEFIHLAVMDHWLHNGLKAGFSDHHDGLIAAQAALSNGAFIVEKHFTIDRNLPGGDNSMSLLPEQLTQLIAHPKRHDIDTSLPFWGKPRKAVQPGERPEFIRRAAVASRNISSGVSLKPKDIIYQRVGFSSKALLGPERALDTIIVQNPLTKGEPIALCNLKELSHD